MKTILLISYYWPPSGKNSVHWPLFILKHLRKFGWGASILTIDEDSFSSEDKSLLAEIDPSWTIVRTSALDPFSLYKRFLGKNKNEPLIASETMSLQNNGWRHRLSLWIRMNIFVPDARVGWYISALGGGKKIVAKERPSVIVTIGPPHSTHLIGQTLSKRFGIPHVPVFIDPWTDVVYYKDFKRTSLTRFVDRYFERSVIKHAKAIIFVTESLREDFCNKYPDAKNKSHVLHWGYNEEAFVSLTVHPSQETTTILNAGNMYDYQNPPALWKNIKAELELGKPLQLRFVGTVSPGIKKSLDDYGLLPITEFAGFLPYHNVAEEMMRAQYLVVCVSENRHVPGKLFEYMRTGNKIIAFGDENSEVQKLLAFTHSGLLFPKNYAGTDIFQQLSSLEPNPDEAKKFNREIIAERFAKILDDLLDV